MPRYAFGPFELDPEARLLRRDGKPVPLTGKTLDTLVLLVENRGRLVDKEELLSHVWGGTVVEEANLTQTIFTVRKILGDSPKDHRYIATVPGRGYQFVAPVRVTEPGAPRKPTGSELRNRARDLRNSRISWRTVALSAVLLVMAVLLIPRQYLQRPLDLLLKHTGLSLREWQLTANPEDTPVTSGVISPDGKLLVYSDPTGLYTKQVNTGETHPIPLPEDFKPRVESWFPDGGHLLVSWAEQPNLQPCLWKISLFGGQPWRIASKGYSASVSPDGSHIVSVRQLGPGEEIWLMRADGGHEKRLIGSVEDSFSRAAWAPDSTGFAYARTKTRYYANRRAPDTLIEVFDIHSQRSVVVVQDAGERGLPRGGVGLAWLADGRLIFPRREPRPNQQDTNLWSLRFDQPALSPRGPSTRITNGKGIAVELSSSKDGKRMALRRHAPQPDIYIADIGRGSNGLGKLRRLTLDERLDYAMDWTADSRAVIFYSNRDGPFHVFKQAIDATQPELLVGGSDDLYVPRITPDGLSLIYIVRPKAGAASNNSRIMRLPLAGGVPQPVLEAPGLFDLECTRPPGDFCFYGQIEDSRAHLFTFDPKNGNAVALSEIEGKLDSFNWVLSHDGKYLAWQSENTSSKQFGVRVFTLTGKLKCEVPVQGWLDLYGLDWAADSQSLWACARDAQGNSALLNVGLDHKITTVLSHPYLSLEWAVPSPDGRYLALVQNSNRSNISLLTNF